MMKTILTKLLVAKSVSLIRRRIIYHKPLLTRRSPGVGTEEVTMHEGLAACHAVVPRECDEGG